WRMNEWYAKLLYSDNTHQVPHIWDPQYLRASAAQFATNPFYRRPPDNEWKVGVLDPTVNITKTFHLPFMACEEAYRLEPQLFKSVLLFNAFRFREMQHLLSMLSVMDLGEDNKVTVEERFQTAFLMGNHVHAVVNHQWENNLSYLYWDVLYLG